MKIIKKGKIEVNKRFICKNCGCIWEAEEGEYQESHRIPLIENVPEYECKCPTCHNMAYTL